MYKERMGKELYYGGKNGQYHDNVSVGGKCKWWACSVFAVAR